MLLCKPVIYGKGVRELIKENMLMVVGICGIHVDRRMRLTFTTVLV
jgi:hypothetical protein